jgi:hypothetical protein
MSDNVFSEAVCPQEHGLIRSALQILILDEEEGLYEGCLTQTTCPLQGMMTCSCKLIQTLMVEEFNVNKLNSYKTAVYVL